VADKECFGGALVAVCKTNCSQGRAEDGGGGQTYSWEQDYLLTVREESGNSKERKREGRGERW